ncbi:MAG TPA: hypothetical protein DCS28_04135 [Candidatus Moranbacteria bacterium]|nr:hypothetical protein [Candidatus Moranbacteria bacterium]HAT75198.1 hypothetical protein [Candidatus Moranbacteria bacterium]
MPSEIKKPIIIKDFKDLGDKLDKASLPSVDVDKENDKTKKTGSSLNGHLKNMLQEVVNEQNKEAKKRDNVSRFLWEELKSAIEKRFGAGMSFKRFITDEMANSFIKKLGELFYINEKGFIKSKKGLFNEFAEGVKKFKENYLADIDNAIEKKEKVKEKKKEKEIKIKESGELRKRNFLEKYPIGTHYHSENSGVLVIENYISALKSDKDRVEISCGKNGFPEETKKISRKEFFEMMKEYSKESAIASSGIAPENPESETEFNAEQEFTEGEKEILEIYLEDAKEMVDYINSLDYEGEFGYREDRVAVLRDADLERFWDKFEQGILKEAEFVGEKLKKAIEYWKKRSMEK